MREDRKYVRKSFWVHQYEKEEEFLSGMAREGWHFDKLHRGMPTKYEFVKGEKIDYVYQLDFVTTEEDTANYHQLFEDTGWNEVYSWPGAGGKWFYFRRIHVDGREERIFTDTESKYQMYEKLWRKFGGIFLIALLLELNGIRVFVDIIKETGLVSVWGIASLVFCCFLAFISVLLIYWVIGIAIEK
ncbi:MAG: DUF2812 domain-containing protein, partial [Bacillota bacterium]|nr:DUF2812 domain-containing protein [Bacillota bacterium]